MKQKICNPESLIPDIRNWNSGEGVDIATWISSMGDFRKMIGYSTIFWPKFVEFNDCILLDGFSEEYFWSFMKQTGNQPQEVEKVMNGLHVVDFHRVGCEDATRERVEYIGEILKDIYECKLCRDFPTRKFTVKLLTAPDDPKLSQGLRDIELVFHQV